MVVFLDLALLARRASLVVFHLHRCDRCFSIAQERLRGDLGPAERGLLRSDVHHEFVLAVVELVWVVSARVGGAGGRLYEAMTSQEASKRERGRRSRRGGTAGGQAGGSPR